MFSFRKAFLALVALTALTASCQYPKHNIQTTAPVDSKQTNTPVVPPRTNLKKFIGQPIVVMISIDGFRHDYLEKYQPPTLLAWAKEGVRSEGITPSFPTLTFPNHISLVTGRRPGHHGIVGNTFFDEARQEGYSIGTSATVNDGTWYRGEPLWTTAEKNGMLSATCFWVGSEAKIGGIDPTYLKPYDKKVPGSQRVDWVIDWLQLPEDRRPHMVTLYFEAVDDAGHKYGPNTPETKQAVLDVDKELGRLKSFIDSSGQPIQVIVVSDHGMKEINETIDLSGAQELMKMKDSGRGALVYFYSSDDDQIEKAYAEVKAIQAQNPGKFQVYKADDLPARWALDDVNRRGDIIVVGEPGVYIGYKRAFETSGPGSSNKGTHGWDVANAPEMRGLFIASGPMFKKGLTIPPVDNVHVYPLVLNMLKLSTMESHDGDLNVLKPILSPTK